MTALYIFLVILAVFLLLFAVLALNAVVALHLKSEKIAFKIRKNQSV
jgi:hypothetical protein